MLFSALKNPLGVVVVNLEVIRLAKSKDSAKYQKDPIDAVTGLFRITTLTQGCQIFLGT
jgi:hypothetical protein